MKDYNFFAPLIPQKKKGIDFLFLVKLSFYLGIMLNCTFLASAWYEFETAKKINQQMKKDSSLDDYQKILDDMDIWQEKVNFLEQKKKESFIKTQLNALDHVVKSNIIQEVSGKLPQNTDISMINYRKDSDELQFTIRGKSNTIESITLYEKELREKTNFKDVIITAINEVKNEESISYLFSISLQGLKEL